MNFIRLVRGNKVELSHKPGTIRGRHIEKSDERNN